MQPSGLFFSALLSSLVLAGLLTGFRALGRTGQGRRVLLGGGFRFRTALFPARDGVVLSRPAADLESYLSKS